MWRVLLVTLLAAGVPLRADSEELSFSTPISGDSVAVTLTLTDAPGGDGVDIAISIPPGSGDLLGLFGSVSDESLVPQLGLSDSEGIVTQWQFAVNQVKKVGAGNTVLPAKDWDLGLKLGRQGSADGPTESASFRLAAPWHSDPGCTAWRWLRG